ncbi:SBBP repeat-containing protein [Candidatus Lokiarchaeum ossiferum]|uniref:SBBP repeat-containing protein n=1 Tax=Candidatus Lokiarchaeum ossiferum TaxID=2951803 RepID=UPI00352FC6E6
MEKISIQISKFTLKFVVIALILLFLGQSNTQNVNAEVDATDNDPTLSYSSFLGGTKDEYNKNTLDLAHLDVVSDSQDNIIIVGRSTSLDYPTKNAIQDNCSGGSDIVITKFASDGKTLLFSTYFGGTGNEWATGVAVDSNDDIIISGSTGSSNFPLVEAYQSQNNGGGMGNLDLFIMKLSSDGQTIIFSTYFGGGGDDWGYSVILDHDNNILVTGSTSSSDLPLKNAVQPIFGGVLDGYITKFNPEGSALLFSTYIGSDSYDWGYDLAIDSLNNAIMIGGSRSENLFHDESIVSTSGGSTDILIAKLSPTGTYIFWSLLGSELVETGISVDVNNNDDIIFASNVPDQSSFQNLLTKRTYGKGKGDIGIGKLSKNGKTLQFITILGGSEHDEVNSIEIDQKNHIIIAGQTFSDDFSGNNMKSRALGGGDAFCIILSSQGYLAFSTYIGGSKTDNIQALTKDSDNNPIFAGFSLSPEDFPIVDAFQSSMSSNKYEMIYGKIVVVSKDYRVKLDGRSLIIMSIAIVGAIGVSGVIFIVIKKKRNLKIKE